jgi:hypothetical protein
MGHGFKEEPKLNESLRIDGIWADLLHYAQALNSPAAAEHPAQVRKHILQKMAEKLNAYVVVLKGLIDQDGRVIKEREFGYYLAQRNTLTNWQKQVAEECATLDLTPPEPMPELIAYLIFPASGTVESGETRPDTLK